MSAKFNLYKTLYRLKRITAQEVWSVADNGDITNDEAVIICGARPL